jgi:SAM-dependent methyltransferase
MLDDKVQKTIDAALADGQFVGAVLSDPRKGEPDDGAAAAAAPRRVRVKPVRIRGELRYQFEYHHDDRKVTHRNLAPADANVHLGELLTTRFRQAQISTRDAETHVRIGEGRARAVVRTKRAAAAAPAAPVPEHNRAKNHLLPEGTPHPFLVRLGVMTREGRVVAARYDKFRQINRFLEMVADIADHLPAPPAPVRVLDFGAGKAYLTFALYHYLRVVQDRPAGQVRIVGLDLKADVVAHCNQIARDLGYEEGLSFVTGDIAGYEGPGAADLVVSLHACDTATDDALAKAVEWNAKVILAVPCCQHELFRQIGNETMRPLTKHGIFKERLSALVTDAVRAHLLETAGYGVQVLEFVDTEHTPKNLLLRAVRRDAPPAEPGRLAAEYHAFRDFWNLRPYLESVLPGMGAEPPSPLPPAVGPSPLPGTRLRVLGEGRREAPGVRAGAATSEDGAPTPSPARGEC